MYLFTKKNPQKPKNTLYQVTSETKVKYAKRESNSTQSINQFW